jgi:ATP-dependent DNA helicase RecQ
MANLDEYKKILTRYWGYSQFRPLQEDVIRSVSERKDTLVLMPTGGGKSITFQVPALAMDGICIVVSPLIALMKDQVDRLKSMDIRAMAIHTGMLKEEISISLDNCIYGDYKFLYISPERLRSEVFRARVVKMNVCMVAVDEAHCISQWGYDFRPSYLRIAELRDLLPPDTPILGLTATATLPVVDDIMEKLRFRQKNALSTSFSRKNLIYISRKVEDKESYLLRTLSNIRGQGIIYVRSRKNTREIATLLNKNDISADYYHAGLSRELREQKQNAWMSSRSRIIVSTNAFGMGIDKEDVRFVVHWDIPDSIESYFQESGRAGRDSEKAWAVQLFNNSDISRARDRVRTGFPPVEKIKDVYELLCNFIDVPVGSGKNGVYDFNLADFVSKYKLSVSEAYNSLKFLEKDSYIELTEELNNPSRVHFIVSRDDLYKFQVANSSLDGFIKLLLRSYTGMFNDFVAVNEDFISRKSGLDRDKVYKFLTHLSSHNVIKYIPGKKSALIILIEERLERKALRITKENHIDVKKRFVERLESMIGYISSESKCRSVALLEYFGQESPRCGTCDICQSRNELDMSKYEFDVILDKLKSVLTENSIEIEPLLALLGGDEEKVIKVVRWLLDHDKILQDSDKKLVWNN